MDLLNRLPLKDRYIYKKLIMLEELLLTIDQLPSDNKKDAFLGYMSSLFDEYKEMLSNGIEPHRASMVLKAKFKKALETNFKGKGETIN